MSKRRHNFGTKRFKEKSLFIFHARIALKSLILLFVRLIARGARIRKTHRQTDRQTDRHTDRTSTVTLVHARRGLTTVQCSIPSQLNNKPRVVVTDFRLYHTCSIIILWFHSLSGVIRSLLCNPRAFSPAIIGTSLSEPLLDELAGVFLWYIYIYIYIYLYPWAVHLVLRWPPVNAQRANVRPAE